MNRRSLLQSVAVGGAAAAFSSTSRVRGLNAQPTRRADPIRLSSNENALGLSPKARSAVIAGISDANRYPSGRDLVTALATHHGLPEDHIVLGNGSTEILQMVVQLLGKANATFIIADPTFEDVPRYTVPWNLKLVKVPLRSDYSHDLDAMQDMVRRISGPALVYLCNPNNPTGTITSADEIDRWIENADDRVNFLIDEAYHEYGVQSPQYRSAERWVRTQPNVVVARTFSKIYGMAGLRLGYALSHPSVTIGLKSLAGQNNANHLAVVAGLASLRDADIVARSLESNTRARQIVEQALDHLGLKRLPSFTNFMMHEIRGDLKQYIDRMRDAGFLVGRQFPPMLGYNRLSFGLPSEMEQFAEALQGFRRKGWI